MSRYCSHHWKKPFFIANSKYYIDAGEMIVFAPNGLFPSFNKLYTFAGRVKHGKPIFRSMNFDKRRMFVMCDAIPV